MADIKSSTILAIESSCDDTSAAVIRDGMILSNVTAHQDVHMQYGGVIPELASRQHDQHIIPVVDAALRQSGVSREELNAIAFTQGPGLMGSLLIGCSTAKAMAMALDIPLIGVNHMEAHILAHFIDEPRPELPFLCLTVSGGHTQIVHVRSARDMEVLGTTRDDAAGEAFDKIGKYLGLPYPAGPEIDKLAKLGEPKYPFGKSKLKGIEFSFSGLKTAVLYFLKKEMKQDDKFIKREMNNICASVQKTIIDILIEKLILASKETDITQIGIGGGVSANAGLRSRLEAVGQERGWSTYIPRLEYCTDNAAMIAITAHYMYQAGEFVDLSAKPDPRMKI